MRAHTHDATSPTQHNGTSASWRVSHKTAPTYKPRTPYRTLARRIQAHRPSTPARHPAQPPPLRTAQSSPQAHRCAHATHSTAHGSDHPTRRPQKITPSHTRGLRTTLTEELSGCPASTGCCRRVGCCATPSPCRTHEQPPRHTIAPAGRPQRIAAQRTTSIRSSQMKAGQHTACYRAHTTPCASDPNNNTTRQPTGT
jgi:hypothetical protein